MGTRRGRKRLSVALVLGIGVVLLVGTPVTSAVNRATSPTTLTIRLASDWTNLDFQRTALEANQAISLYTTDTLLSRDPVTNEFIPYLASSWKQTPDSITFKLRKGPKCPDGTPINALTVLKSFKRMLQASTDVQAFFGPGPFHVKADRYKNTFTFSSETPNSDMIWIFAGFAKGAIVCPAGLAAIAADPLHAFDNQIYGSGPYSIASAEHGNQIVLKKNKAWNWGPKGVTAKDLPDTVILKIVTDETTSANQLLTGELDLGTVSGTDAVRLLQSNSLLNHSYHVGVVTPLYMNQRPGQITADLQVRRAIFAAVSPKGFQQAALAGLGVLSPTLLAPDTRCFDKNAGKSSPTMGVASAQSIMKADGWTLGSNGRFIKNGRTAKLVVLTPTTTLGNVGDFMSSALSQAGFDVTLQNLPFASYGLSVRTGNYDVAPGAGFGNWPSPGAGIGYAYGATSAQGGSNYANAGLDYPNWAKEIKAAQGSVGAESCKHWAKVQQMMNQYALMAPLAAPIYRWFANKSKVASFSLIGQTSRSAPNIRWVRLNK